MSHRPLVLIAALLVAFALGSSHAQPLARLAPPDTVLSLSLRDLDDTRWEGLKEDLAALEWARMGELVGRLGMFLDQPGGPNADPSLGDELFADCPALEAPLEALGWRILGRDALLTVGLNPFNPLPSLTAMARLDGGHVPHGEAVQQALVACYGSDVTFEQDGVPLHLLFDGSELPLIVARVSDLFILSSNPDAARGVVRRAQGSDEPSLADRPLQQRTDVLFEPGGLGFSLDLAAIAEVAAAFAPMLMDDPELEPLFARALAALKTVGGVAGKLSATPEGFVIESLTAVDPEGGDAALAELLLCERCAVGRPFLAPPQSVAIRSQHLPLRGVFAYLQAWADEIAALVGEPLDLKQLALVELGLDLDRALFNWIGSELHTVTLEPFSPRLDTLLYGTSQVFLIPVSDPEAARDGLEHLIDRLVFSPLAGALIGELTPFGALGAAMGVLDIAPLAITREAYGGVDIDRYRLGLNTDIGVALVGNVLVIASPTRALHPVIDTYQGGAGALELEGYLTARRAAPEGSSQVGYSDTRRTLEGVAELLELASQPLAFGLYAGLFSTIQDATMKTDFWLGDLGSAFVPEAAQADVLTPPESVAGALSEAEPSRYYELAGLGEGDTVTVELLSDEFDTYLYLIDRDADTILDQNDDAPDITRSEIVFTAQEGVRYWIEVASFFGDGTGAYTLNVTVQAADSPAEAEVLEDAPSYSELLELTGFAPKLVRLISDRLGSSESYSVLREGSVYQRTLIRFDWER
jgi:hypothetical protein